jgi:hypothetical protein
MNDADGLDVVLAAYGYGLEEGPPRSGDESEEVRPVMVALTAKHWAHCHGRLLGLGGYKFAIWEAEDGSSNP